MAKENLNLDLRLKTKDETRNYFLEEIKFNCLMNEKHNKVSRDLNCFEHFLIFVFAVSGCISVSAFSSFVGVPADIVSSAVGLKICTITKSILTKKRKKHDNI